MTYKEKVRVFRHLAYRANGLNYPPMARWAGDPRPERPKWRSLQELEDYLSFWGGCVKKDTKRRRGFLVVDMNEGIELPPHGFRGAHGFRHEGSGSGRVSLIFVALRQEEIGLE